MKTWLIIFSFTGIYAFAAKAPPSVVLDLRLDATWKCQLDQAIYNCERRSGKNLDLVLWTAKIKHPNDSLEKNFKYLKNPIKQKGFTSEVKYVEMKKIEGQDWLDSLHWQSELSGYYTRYFATFNDKYSVLVTMSATKERFDKVNKELRPVFEKMKIK